MDLQYFPSCGILNITILKKKVELISSQMDSDSIIMIIALICLVVMSAGFSATETAFSSLNKIRLKNMAEDGDKKAALALKLEENYDSLLSTILVGNNVVNITAATLSTVLFTRFFQSYGPTVATVVVTVVILIFGEVTPKSLAKEKSEKFAMAAAPMMQLLMGVFRPINFLFGQWKRLLRGAFQLEEDEGITEEELMTIVSEAESGGGLEKHESELIRAAIEFNDLEVEEILTPRVDVEAVEDTATLDELGVVFAQSGFSRLPIFHDNIDNIVGVIHEKDFHIARYHNRQSGVKQIVSPVIYTTGTTKISSLLRTLQRSKSHMAVVVDEYGGTEGIVTLEDILEELVGEIWDEHDEVIEEFRKQSDGSYLITCNANLTDLYELFSITGECDATTVSGWVLEQIDRVPQVGDHFVYQDLDVTVTRVDHRRVLEIRVLALQDQNREE